MVDGVHWRLLPLPEQHEQHARDLQELEVMLLSPPALVRVLVLTTMSLVLMPHRASQSARVLCTQQVARSTQNKPTTCMCTE